MLKRLIIGKNSKIIKLIRNKIKNADFISHNEISHINLDNYKYIFVFSWSHNSFNDNLKLFNKLPLKKVIFISTISVLSLQKRSQWNSYPIYKKKIENLVLRNKGAVLRLGIFDDLREKHNSSIIPHTTYLQLVNFLNKSEYKNRIYDCFQLYQTKKNLKMIEKFFYQISLLVSEITFLRKGCEAISKFFFKTVFYGYVADTLSFFCNNFQIGYGAIGSEHRKYANNRLIITSDKRDKIISNRGFNNTYIGYNKTGLSKYWHGVYLKRINNKFYKKVPLIVKRNKIPKNSVEGHVVKIINFKDYFVSICKTKNSLIKIYSLKIIFAAGILENIKLLLTLLIKKIKIILNDHEWYNLGYIKTDEAIQKNFIKKKWFLIFRDKLFNKKYKNINLIIEFRPYSKLQLHNDSFKFYSDLNNSIFFKVIKNFTLARINEVFFNKFGFSFYTKRVILTALINNKLSVFYNSEKIKKKRLSIKFLKKLTKEIELKFKSFKPSNQNKTFDAQHINGGEKLLEETVIKNLIRSNKIYIVGFPNKINDNDFYPTRNFILKERLNG